MNSKKPKTRNIRHILESPFNIKWIEKHNEEIVPIQNALLMSLPAARLEKIPLNIKFQRDKEVKETTSRILKPKQQNIYRTYLCPGFQSVVRGLEKGELCCVLVSSDIQPVMLLKVVLVQSQVNSVPVLVIPNLRTITRSTLGFPSMVLGFKNIVRESPDVKFHDIYQMISQNPTLITAPAYPIKAEREKAVSEPMEEVTEDLKKGSIKVIKSIKPKSIYLYKNVNGKRAFTPDVNINYGLPKSEIKTEMDEDFISIKKEPEEPVDIQIPKKSNMMENIVRRISDDDSDSNDEVSFFVDTAADKTLLERLKPETDIVQNKTNSKIDKPKLDKHNRFQQMENTHSNKQKKNKKMKDHLSHLSKVNFKPLQIKTVAGNPNRPKGKKENKN